MNIQVAIAVIAFSAGLAVFLVARRLARIASDPGRRNVEADILVDAGKGYFTLDAWRALDRRTFTVATPRGYDLACEWVSAHGRATPDTETVAGAARPVVVIAHGHSWDRAGSVKYALMFLELSWDAVIFDHRGCGDSGGSGTTMGYFESLDLALVIAAVRAHVGPGLPVGALGESMGAATVLLHAARDPGLAFAVADSSFSDLRELFAHRLRADYHLPAFPVLDVAELLTRMRLGYSYRAVSPRRVLEEASRAGGTGLPPLLIIHGLVDDYVPPSMARELAAAAGGRAELFLVPGAGHAKSWATDRVAYRRAVAAFLIRNGLPASAPAQAP